MESIRVRLKIHHHHSTRPPYYYPRKKVTPLHQDSSWIKKNTNNMFDVTMGSQGRRTNVRVNRSLCDVLDSIQILKWSWPVLWRWSCNLQSDSERNWKIIVNLNLNLNLKLEREKTKEEVIQVFKSNGLKITIDADKKIVNLFYVTFNFTKGSYKPYMKPNNKLSFFHQQSNHPQHYKTKHPTQQ